MLNITDHFTTVTPTAYTEHRIFMYVFSTHASTCKTTSSSLSIGEWTGEGPLQSELPLSYPSSSSAISQSKGNQEVYSENVVHATIYENIMCMDYIFTIVRISFPLPAQKEVINAPKMHAFIFSNDPIMHTSTL